MADAKRKRWQRNAHPRRALKKVWLRFWSDEITITNAGQSGLRLGVGAPHAGRAARSSRRLRVFRGPK